MVVICCFAMDAQGHFIKDPKRKVHKHVKGVLRLEIEKHQISQADLENVSESGSITNDYVDPADRVADSLCGKYTSNGCDDPQGSILRVVSPASGNGATQHGNSDFNAEDVSSRLTDLEASLEVGIRHRNKVLASVANFLAKWMNMTCLKCFAFG